jgi:hypothetical protein
MRKPLIALVALGLVAGAVAAPAQAKKKKKPKPKPPVAAPVQMDQKYFVVNTNESGCAAEGMLLMLTPTDAGGGCGSYFGGPVNTALTNGTGGICTPDTAVQGPICGAITHTAGEGLPVTLDATKKITGTIFVASYRGVSSVPVAGDNPVAAGAGPTTFNMRLYGTVDGEPKEIGTFTSDYTVTPDKRVYEVPFEIALDPALDKAELSALAVDFWNTGPAALHGFYNANDSNIVLPVWKLAS